MAASLGQAQLDLALVALDLLDADADGVAEPIRPAAAPADESRSERVQLEIITLEAPRGQVALEDLPEADEDPRADCADDLALEFVLPAELEELLVEQPGQADLACEVLDLSSLPL